MATDVSSVVRQAVENVSEDIQAEKFKIPETYDGPEFATPT